MYFITVQVLLILMPYHMLVLVKSLKKAVFILKRQPRLACNTASAGVGGFSYLTG